MHYLLTILLLNILDSLLEAQRLPGLLLLGGGGPCLLGVHRGRWGGAGGQDGGVLGLLGGLLLVLGGGYVLLEVTVQLHPVFNADRVIGDPPFLEMDLPRHQELGGWVLLLFGCLRAGLVAVAIFQALLRE